MSNEVIGLLFALGAGAWVYAKTARTTGGNTQSAAVFAFLIIWVLLGFVPGL
jgi:hypothetical protein